ncbi:hypothetical protein CYQ71_06810, partial [Enterococcus faecium]
KSVDRDISDTYFNKMCQRIKAMNYSGLSFSLEKISVTMENRAKKNQSFSLYIILPIYRNC